MSNPILPVTRTSANPENVTYLLGLFEEILTVAVTEFGRTDLTMADVVAAYGAGLLRSTRLIIACQPQEIEFTKAEMRRYLDRLKDVVDQIAAPRERKPPKETVN